MWNMRLEKEMTPFVLCFFPKHTNTDVLKAAKQADLAYTQSFKCFKMQIIYFQK